ALPEDARVGVMTWAADLAEDNVDLAFTQLARLGLADPLGTVRARAADTLWESTDRGAAEMLQRLVREDPDESVRAAAAASLRHFVVMREFETFDSALGDRIVDALRASVEDTSEVVDVRGLALEALGARTLEWVPRLIADSYNHDERRMRIAAVHAMGANAEERWLEYIHEQFYSDDAEFRFEAAVAAGGIASEESIEPLLPLLDDEDSQVVLAVVETLGEIGGRDALEVLKEFRERAPEGMDEVIAAAIETAVEAGIETGEADGDDVDDE
ncbi:MAG: HEAT repeat domain-containing protein, partial [Tepidiformaceae bacterium]